MVRQTDGQTIAHSTLIKPNIPVADWMFCSCSSVVYLHNKQILTWYLIMTG